MKDHINTISTTTEAHNYYEQGYKQGRADVINKLLDMCGGGRYESDCDLCTFAIFRDNVRIGCKLKEQSKENNTDIIMV